MLPRRRILFSVALSLLGIFWLAGVGLPLFTLIASARTSDVLLFDPTVLHIALTTFGQAALSAALSVIFGLPIGLLLARTEGRTSRVAEALFAIPFGVPTVVAAMGWIAWLGRSGPFGFLGWAYGFPAVVLAHFFFNTPWVALSVSQTQREVSRSCQEAAATLGASPSRVFWEISWPALKWTVGAAGIQVYALCAMSFALVLILGGGPPVQTLETAIYTRIRYGELDLPGALSCALWQLFLTLVPWLILTVFRGARTERSGELPKRGALARPMGTLFLFLIELMFLLPFLPTLLKGFSFAQDVQAWAETLPAWRASLAIATLTAFGAVFFSTLAALVSNQVAALSRAGSFVFEILAGMPSGISTLVLAVGIWLAYSGWIDPFEGSLPAIVLVQVVLFFPVAYRILWPVGRRVNLVVLEAAWTLGASPQRAWLEVEWPRWRGPLISSVALVFGASLGEVAAVSLFYNEKLVPIPLLVTRWMSRYRFAEAEGLSAWLCLASILVMGAVILAPWSFGRKINEIRLAR